MTPGAPGAGAVNQGRGRTPGITDLTYERGLVDAGLSSVVGMDEVGRGCIAGPVGVGAVWCDLTDLCEAPVIAGLRDSKKLSAARRVAIDKDVRGRWPTHAVAYASPEEIDRLGISRALGLAGLRALAQLPATDRIMLDGSFDWLSPAARLAGGRLPPVSMHVKGDDTHIPIAAASVLAKVARDALMARLDAENPGYGWASNVGYPSPAHKQAVATLGVTRFHRRSFRLGV